jgi:hypothetical protein
MGVGLFSIFLIRLSKNKITNPISNTATITMASMEIFFDLSISKKVSFCVDGKIVPAIGANQILKATINGQGVDKYLTDTGQKPDRS